MPPSHALPKGWERRSIADLFDIRASGDIDWTRWSREQDTNHLHPVYANGRADSGLHGYASYAVEKGDAITLTSRGTLGELGFAFFRSTAFTPIGRLLVLRSRGEADARFFASYINGLVRFAQENTGVAQLTAPQIARYQIDLPPLAEQHAISTALSDVDALIAGLEKLIAKKRDLKQAAMQQLLTGQTRLPGFSGEWVEACLGDLARIQRGASPRPIESPFWFDDTSSVGWVRISDVTSAGMYLTETQQRLSPLGIQYSRPVERGNLIMSICATVGRPVITEIDVCIHDGFVVFDKPQADKYFLYYVLKWIEPNWSKQGQTGSQMNLNTPLINGTKIMLPPTDEQKSIASALSEMDADLTAQESRLAKTRDLKQGMMQELLTGRTRLV